MARLLVVEDDPDIRLLTELLLAEHGHAVLVASNGQEGLALLADRLPDLIVMDLDMPILSGPGMAAQMLVRNCGRENIPIIMASASETLDREAARIGTPYFLSKPFTEEAMLRMVDRALRERRIPRPPLRF